MNNENILNTGVIRNLLRRCFIHVSSRDSAMRLTLFCPIMCSGVHVLWTTLCIFAASQWTGVRLTNVTARSEDVESSTQSSHVNGTRRLSTVGFNVSRKYVETAYTNSTALTSEIRMSNGTISRTVGVFYSTSTYPNVGKNGKKGLTRRIRSVSTPSVNTTQTNATSLETTVANGTHVLHNITTPVSSSTSHSVHVYAVPLLVMVVMILF